MIYFPTVPLVIFKKKKKGGGGIVCNEIKIIKYKKNVFGDGARHFWNSRTVLTFQWHNFDYHLFLRVKYTVFITCISVS